MKLVFYLENAGYKNIDYSRLEEGNPGLGGTEYIILITTLLLSREINKQQLQDAFTILVAAQNIEGLPSELTCAKVSGLVDVLSMDADYVFFKYEKEKYYNLTHVLDEHKKHNQFKHTKLIVWAHNLIDRKERTAIDRDKNVKMVLCVSREQMNLYRDHHLFLKSSYIYNGIPLDYLKTLKPALKPYSARPYEVTSIGSIDYYKGFHLIAKAWKTVLEAIPEAKLNVIGSGKLYDRNSKMGKYGIAEESYENSFMPYLTEQYLDENGITRSRLLPSVKFWGLMGVEKNEVLKNTRVGVPNPMGKESFCLVALEMQSLGAMITTKDYGGFRNTVFKTGKLFKNSNDLAKDIIYLLKEDSNHLDECYQWMEANFAYDKVIKDWLELFKELNNDSLILGCKKLPYRECKTDYLGWLREENRKIKSVLCYKLPTIEFYRSLLRRIGLVRGM